VADQHHDRCTVPRPGWELLAGPGPVNQRRYEALRAYLYEGASLQRPADAACTRYALASLVRDLLAGRLTVFARPGVPGRKSAAAPFLVVVMRVSGSGRITGDYLNGNAAKLLGWLTATLTAAAAIALFAAGGIRPFLPGEVPDGA
jgi:hypothetical protein